MSRCGEFEPAGNGMRSTKKAINTWCKKNAPQSLFFLVYLHFKKLVSLIPRDNLNLRGKREDFSHNSTYLFRCTKTSKLKLDFPFLSPWASFLSTQSDPRLPRWVTVHPPATREKYASEDILLTLNRQLVSHQLARKTPPLHPPPLPRTAPRLPLLIGQIKTRNHMYPNVWLRIFLLK